MPVLHLVNTIRKRGCRGQHGNVVYGNAALLRVLHLIEQYGSSPINKIDQHHIKLGKMRVEKILNA